MTSTNLPRLGRLANRARKKPTTTVSVAIRPAAGFPRIPPHPRPQLSEKPIVTSRRSSSNCFFSTSSRLTRPLAADVLGRVKPVDLTDAQYHELSDEYLDNLLNKFEAAQDERDDMDVEYSAGVMNVNIASLGTYVINKQPPNKQIWLSSPVSGPKRFDYVIVSDGQHQKEGTATGGWVYLRDGATLNEILYEETGVDPEEPPLDSVDG